MRPFKLMLTVLKLTLQSFSTPSNQHHSLFKPKILSQLTGSKKFHKIVETQQQNSSRQPITSIKLINKCIRSYFGLFVTVILLSIAGVLAMILQPYLNQYLKSKINQKFDDHLAVIVPDIIGIYLLYKLATSFLYIALDFCSMILGVKFYSTITHKLLTPNPNSTQITCLEDDSQRLQNLPSSSTTSITKTIQFITFSSILISRLPSEQTTVAFAYGLFFTISICLAISSSKLNFKIMKSKQQRIKIEQEEDNIRKQRVQQIKMIKNLMIVDGIGLILPWLLNVVLMIIIYGIVGMPKQQKYFVLTIFGLLRASISGLGTNLNYFAQSWSSLQRISSFLILSNSSGSLSETLINNSLIIKQQIVQPQSNLPRSQPTLTTLFQFCKQSTPLLLPILILLTSLQFSSSFMYGYCAKSIIIGESIFSPFNITALALQLLSPILLYSFICYVNQRLSSSVYQRLLVNGVSQLQKIGAEGINRLAGDIRLLDRQLYFATYGSISHLTSIAASLLYSIVILNNTFSSILLTLVIFLSIWVSWLSYRFISLRKESYRLQATNKGKILKALLKNVDPLKAWRSVYTFKCFGFSIQVTFISILYSVVIIVSCIIITVVMLSSATVEDSSVLILLISQLDYQFLVLFVQVVMMQTATAAACRCLDILNQIEKRKNESGRI